MSSILDLSIQKVLHSKAALCKFITPNDTGATGGHQSGYHISKIAWPMFLNKEPHRGENIDKLIRIRWQDEFDTDSRFKYYGVGTRNEYRITRFGRGFPFLNDENVGELLVLTRYDDDYYEAFVLNTDEDIDEFFSFFNLSFDKTNQIIDVCQKELPDKKMVKLINDFIQRYDFFPDTQTMANAAKACYNEAYGVMARNVMANPDDILLEWINTEYSLFKSLEEKIYADVCLHPFPNLSSFITLANEVLNRRKARAGKSLELHLASIFETYELRFEEQVITEGKKPDFVFPNIRCYHNLEFPGNLLTILAAKTTCKDRWRQVLSEADRVKEKFLFTLQQGISSNQLKEMIGCQIQLVVPHKNLTTFPREYQSEISDLATFINMVKMRQSQMPKHFFIHFPS